MSALHLRGPLAFGGLARLEGHKLVRLVYLDEGGVSKPERFVVVSGVMIDADNEMIAIEEHLEGLVEKHIPEGDRENFVFHTTDIWSGGKYFKNRDVWSLDKRLAILDDLVAIPAKFKIPILLGFVDKTRFPFEPLPRVPTEEELDVGAHAVAFAACTMTAERTMRELWPNEVAMLIAEDRPSVKTAIKEAHALYRSEASLKANQIEVDCFPLKRIRDTVHFAQKKECRHLQLADVCTFFIRGHLTRHPQNPRFYEILKPLLLFHPNEDALA